ncbi:hypothetical protein Ddc_12935 [Ditylenchus destructor]|nr:hypothetical protein Ddc_12935 [Ditylenchus destructor]
MHVSNYFAVMPVLVFFITLDRCLALKLPMVYGKRMQKLTLMCAIVATVLVYVMSTTFTLLELPLQYEQLNGCYEFSCGLLKFKALPHFLCKMGFSTANFILTIYFLWLMRTTVSNNSFKNSVVKFTLVTEFCLNLVPSYFGYMFFEITGEISIKLAVYRCLRHLRLSLFFDGAWICDGALFFSGAWLCQ